jgi:hypothetical protein
VEAESLKRVEELEAAANHAKQEALLAKKRAREAEEEVDKKTAAAKAAEVKTRSFCSVG